MKKRVHLLVTALVGTLVLAPQGWAAQVSEAKGKIILRTGILERTLDLARGNGITGTIAVKGKPTCSGRVPELLLTISRAEPNRRPDAFQPGAGSELDSHTTFNRILTPDFLDDKRLGQTVAWVEPVTPNGADLASACGAATYHLEQPTALFANQPLGTFTGRQLRKGTLKLSLPKLGQEIVEVKPLGKPG